MGWFDDEPSQYRDRGDKALEKELAKIKPHEYRPRLFDRKICAECGVRRANHRYVGGPNT